MIDMVAATAAESERFATAAADVAALADSATATVPSCPDWSVDDLVWHLTEVQHFWASIVGGRLDDPSDAGGQTRPAGPDLVATFLATSARLIEALEGADPAAPCWTWYEPDQRVGWVQRRQANEALIHRVDAELALAAVGGPDVGPIDPELAADGIDEFLLVMLGADPLPAGAQFTAEPDRIGLVAADAPNQPTWSVQIGRLTGVDPDGTAVDEGAITVSEFDPATPHAAIVRGPAAELDRWLWRRGRLETAAIEGDRGLVERLPDVAGSG